MYHLDDCVYEILHRQYEAGFQSSFTQKKMTRIYKPARLPRSLTRSFRRFGARCDDARHCEQSGVVFEANFFAKVHPSALELCIAWAS